jgi:hypothetical protein
MKRWSRRSVNITLVAVVIAPLCVSVAWKSAAGACDYIAQAGLTSLMVAPPFWAPVQSGFTKQFGLFYAVGFVWGLWRVFYFDWITRNDVPGIGYLILPAVIGGISALIFWFRKRLASGGSK